MPKLEIFMDAKIPDDRFPKFHDRSAGFDICAHVVQNDGVFELPPLHRVIVPTGLRFKIPYGHEVQIRSRSGLAAMYGIIVLNSPGTIDEDYRGEIKVILYNSSAKTTFIMRDGDRIAQGVLAPVLRPELVRAHTIDFDTARGAKGLGSTGV